MCSFGFTSKFCAACDNWLPGEGFWHYDVQDFGGSADRDACLASCQSTPGCGSLSFSKTHGWCYLKSVLPSSVLTTYWPDLHSYRVCSAYSVRTLWLTRNHHLTLSKNAASCNQLPGTACSPVVRFLFWAQCYLLWSIICIVACSRRRPLLFPHLHRHLPRPLSALHQAFLTQ